MSAVVRCDCCDLPVESCGRAAEQRQREEARRERERLLARGWFPAQYAGRCEGCGEHFEPGALIHADPCGWRSDCCETP